jgi:chromosome segregation ATPase
MVQAAEDRSAYQAKIERELAQADEVVEELRARAEQADEEVQDEYMEQIRVLEEIRDRARARLEELKAADEATWSNLKPGLDGLMSELRKAVANATFNID